MHDTLANRGRVNYDTYSRDELTKVKQITNQYLSGDIEEIEEINSLRMIREIFNQIRNEYKHTAQNIESIKRQMKENPDKFKAMLEEQKRQEEEEANKDKEEVKQEEAPEQD